MPQNIFVNQLTDIHSKAKQKLADRHPRAWQKLNEGSKPIGDLITKTKDVAATAAVVGTLAAASTTSTIAYPTNNHFALHSDRDIDVSKPSPPLPVAIQQEMKEIVPKHPSKLTATQSHQVSQKLQILLNIKAVSTLDGYELNTDYGYMGAEQHLPRFVGDTLAQHDALQVSGITKKRGAFGYFASSQAAITQEQIAQEKYYVAVQSFLSPQWSTDARGFKEWLKFRKVLVVQTHTGKAIAAVIGDAGPAKWTGKQFGGSPEVMYHINNGKRVAKAPVLLLFIDDPHNQIPLGPVN